MYLYVLCLDLLVDGLLYLIFFRSYRYMHAVYIASTGTYNSM